jgi:nicotinamidase/pyrazinamidase
MDYTPSTALIVVDFQNDFADPSGSLYVSGGEEAIEFVNSEIEQARSGGATIVYSQDWHPPSTPHFAKDGGIWPVHCVAGSPGARLHPELEVAENAVMIKKGGQGEDGYSAFSMKDPETGEVTSTGLDGRLTSTEKVVIVGLALDYCVKETALDAVSRFETVVLADGTRAVNLAPGDGARAVAAMVSSGVTVA